MRSRGLSRPCRLNRRLAFTGCFAQHDSYLVHHVGTFIQILSRATAKTVGETHSRWNAWGKPTSGLTCPICTGHVRHCEVVPRQPNWYALLPQNGTVV